MAKEAGISLSSVQRIWTEHDLQPHPDPNLQTLERPSVCREAPDIVGLYVDPPAHSLVLSVERESENPGTRSHPARPAPEARQSRHLDAPLQAPRHHHPVRRAQRPRRPGDQARCMAPHRHQEFLRFLNAIEREVPAGKVIHVILDNYAPHKHPKVCAWLARHPRWTFHFTPTSGSSLNAVENFSSQRSPEGRSGAGIPLDRGPAGREQPLSRRAQSDSKPLHLDPLHRCHPRQACPNSCTFCVNQCTRMTSVVCPWGGRPASTARKPF